MSANIANPTVITRSTHNPAKGEIWTILSSQFAFRIETVGPEKVSGELLDGYGTKTAVDILFLERRVNEVIKPVLRENEVSIGLVVELGGIND